MKDEGLWEGLRGTVAIILAAVLVFSGIMGAMFLYAGMWPPLSIVESDSMQHDPDSSRLGVIDTGDLVIVQASDGSDVITYVEGLQTGHRMFGDYGDVIIYRPEGSEDRKPIIHRPVLWLEPEGVDRWSAPSLQGYPAFLWSVTDGDHQSMAGVLVLEPYGHASVRLEIDLNSLPRHAGFITHGDNNHQNGIGFADQMALEVGGLIKEEWVISKAAVEIPWIGSLSLLVRNVNVNQIPINSIIATFGVIAAVVVLPFALEFAYNTVRRRT